MFGLKNSGNFFVRVITEIFEPLFHLGISLFVDDLSTITSDWNAHLRALEAMFKIMIKHNIRCNLGKCSFCAEKLKLLGYVIDKNGIQFNPDKMKILQNWPIPSTLKALRRFLGLANWFRRFVMHFSTIAEPLYELFKGGNAKFYWTSAQDDAFHALKGALLAAPILSPPDHAAPWHLFSDASGTGLAGLLSQKDAKSKFKTVDLVSRRLSAAERKFSTSERELLSIIFCLRKWRHLIEGNVVNIYTDHRPLVVLQKLKNPTGRLARWILELSSYNCNLLFRPGRSNQPADALSRYFEEDGLEPEKINPVLIPCRFEGSDEVIYALNDKACVTQPIELEQLSFERIAEEQAKDPFCGILLLALKGQPHKCDSPSIRRFLDRFFPKAVLDTEKELIYIDVSHCPELSNNLKLLIPKSLQEHVIRLAHDTYTGGHYGFKRTLKSIFRLYTFPRATKLVSRFCSRCVLCKKVKAQNSQKLGKVLVAPLSGPFTNIYLDLKGPLPISKRRNQYLLVVICPFSNWVEAYPMRTATTQNIVTKLCEEFFPRFGMPYTCTTDNAQNLISNALQMVYHKFGIKPVHISVYRPQSNKAEIAVKAISEQIRKYVGENHNEWDTNIGPLLLGLNAAPCLVTGYSPAFLTQGRELRLPSDPNDVEPLPQTAPQYVVSLTNKLRRAFQKANERRKAFSEHQHAKINEKRASFEFELGDRCFAKAHYLSQRSRGFSAKLAERYYGPMEVVEKVSPVTYRLRDVETGLVQKHLQHISHLKPYMVQHNDN
jgi:hypothetical protein